MMNVFSWRLMQALSVENSHPHDIKIYCSENTDAILLFVPQYDKPENVDIYDSRISNTHRAATMYLEDECYVQVWESAFDFPPLPETIKTRASLYELIGRYELGYKPIN